jgi:hypothetical protein
VIFLSALSGVDGILSLCAGSIICFAWILLIFRAMLKKSLQAWPMRYLVFVTAACGIFAFFAPVFFIIALSFLNLLSNAHRIDVSYGSGLEPMIMVPFIFGGCGFEMYWLLRRELRVKKGTVGPNNWRTFWKGFGYVTRFSKHRGNKWRKF